MDMKFVDVKSNQVLREFQTNLCNPKGATGFFIRAFLSILETNLNFELKCPFKKASNYLLRSFELSVLAVPLRFQNGEQRKMMHLILKTKSTLLFSLKMFYQEVVVDE
jgi:hypothetical protein